MPYFRLPFSYTAICLEMMEMMMFQNAQVHQMIMQQLMMSAIPKQNQNEANSTQMLNKVVDRMSVSETRYTP